jgi:hypothetical protein
MKTPPINITSNRGTEYDSWSRRIRIEIDGNEYAGTLFYDRWEGYNWDGDDLPDLDTNDMDFLTLLDTLSCDVVDCYGCEKEKAAL